MIEAYEYMPSDIDYIRFNHWCRKLRNKKNLNSMKNHLNSNHSFTFYDEKPIAILCFEEYDKKGVYEACIIADVCFQENPKYAIKMKKLVWLIMDKLKVKRLTTISEDDDKLNKWHIFLGATLEKKNYINIKGIDFNLWSIENGD